MEGNLATVEVRDMSVEYLVDGSGPELVLVHGTGGNAVSNWGHLVDRFSHHSAVVRPNYSGSGNTTDRGGLLSVEQLAEQVVEAIADVLASISASLRLATKSYEKPVNRTKRAIA